MVAQTIKIILIALSVCTICNLSSYAADENLTLSLHDAITRALENSPELKRSQHLNKAALAKVKSASSLFLPTANAVVSAGTTHTAKPLTQATTTSDNELTAFTPERDQNEYLMQANITQSLFAGFSHMKSASAAASAKRAANFEEQIELDETILNAVKIYFNIQLLEHKIIAEKESLETKQAKVHEIERKASAGRATELDLLKARYSVSQSVLPLKKMNTEKEEQEIKLQRLIGEKLGRKFVYKNKIKPIADILDPKKLPSFEEAYQSSLTANNQLQKTQAELQTVLYEGGAKNSSHLPSLDLILSAESRANKRTDILTDDSLKYSGTLKLSVPLFSGFSSFNDAEELREKIAAAKQQEESVRENLIIELRTAYRLWELAQYQEKMEGANVDIGKKAVANAQSLYSAGRGNVSDILEALTYEADAKKNLFQSYYDKIVSFFTIKMLLGKWNIKDFDE